MQEIANETQAENDYLSIAKMYSECAQVYEKLKDYGKAEEFIFKCINAYEYLEKQLEHGDAKKRIYSLYGELASIYEKCGRQNEAKEYAIRSLDSLEHSEYYFRSFLSKCVELKSFEMLEIFSQKAYPTHCLLVKEDTGRSKIENWSEFTNISLNAARICRNADMTDVTIIYLEGCSEVCTMLEKAVNNKNNSIVLAQIYSELGELYEQKKISEKSKNNFLSASVILEEVIKKYGVSSDKSFASYIYLRIAKLLEGENDIENAEHTYLNALKLRAEIYVEDSTSQSQKAMTEYAQHLFAFYGKQGGFVFKLKKAIHLKKAIESWLNNE